MIRKQPGSMACFLQRQASVVAVAALAEAGTKLLEEPFSKDPDERR
jgi:hypothetical protein